ncbi:hypothetical protein R1sor_023257 [Riccia sorocarpa]|uniref:Uncharacterized protein n=1 Tax=Riccia sorocarpa TaxID=122646 RepID=A0ABD3GNN8_9MARC
MSVAVVGREGLASPFCSTEDYLAMRDLALQSQQMGQDEASSHISSLSASIEAVKEIPNVNVVTALSISEETAAAEITAHLQMVEARGAMQYGCTHYRRRCRIRAPCCGEVFDCRHCHNEAKNTNERDPKKRHDLPRHAVQSVICSLCNTEQEVRQKCINCGVKMGEYFCDKCKFFDDETKKEQYHCDSCGICRIGGRDKFFHCEKCGCCYSIVLEQGHPCVEKSMHHNCPVCFEYLFDSMKDITVMPCGHTMHLECLKEMQKHSQYSCPMCLKSVCDMSKMWERLDQEVAATPMPEAYLNKMVWILCNDCGITSQVMFHVLAHKCIHCSSYNTRQTKGPPSTSRS